MPELIVKAKGSGQHSRAFLLDSGESENSATGSKVLGDSVLSTNHEAAIDSNNDGLVSADEDEESDDGVTDIRRVAAFNSLKNFLEVNNLTVFIRVASR